MKRILLFIFIIISYATYAQERIDTLYYNNLGQIAQNAVFADYYRIALYPADSIHHKVFKDFYNSGELRKEGYFLSIDSLDDSKTVFDGEIRSYSRNGNNSEKSHYVNGQLHGEYIRYDDDGKLIIQAFYQDGELFGIYKTFRNYLLRACKPTTRHPLLQTLINTSPHYDIKPLISCQKRKSP